MAQIKYNVMERRHYEQVAQAIKNALTVCPYADEKAVHAQMRIVARSLGAMNNNYNSERFIKAAGIADDC